MIGHASSKMILSNRIQFKLHKKNTIIKLSFFTVFFFLIIIKWHFDFAKFVG